MTSYGTYTWSPGATEWTKLKGAEKLPDETDLVVNLEGLQRDGKTYKMYFPLPTESDFPFRGTSAETSGTYMGYFMDDAYGENAQWLYNVCVQYSKVGDTHQMIFCTPWNHAEQYGTFQWKSGDAGWTKVP